MLRNVPEFDVPLAKMFNDSLNTGIVPTDWKSANVVPIFKSGSRSSCNNYRPVSLTSQVCKLFERIMLENILEHTDRNNIIHCDQHGFQSGCSCVTQLIECLYDWTQNHDEGKETDIIYLDFSKAFDSVPHDRLISKLRNLGIRGKILKWIESFLKGRKQRVIMRNGSSSWCEVISGVPQGSILGPILFLLYVNDLPRDVGSSIKLFADDTKLYHGVETLEDCGILQQDLNKLSAWSSRWLLKFNEKKCVVLKVGQCLNYAYSLNGSILECVEKQKDLGVIINNKLTPSDHIQYLVSKSNRKIHMIRRCFSGLTKEKIYICCTVPLFARSWSTPQRFGAPG